MRHGEGLPGSLLEFEDWFRTEEALRAFLVRIAVAEDHATRSVVRKG